MLRVHDLLRETCITKSGEDGFFHYISEPNTRNYTIENPNLRLSIHHEQNFEEWPALDSTVRSALFFSKGSGLKSELPLGRRRLNVLDAQTITWLNFSDVISTLVNLRYINIVLNYESCPHGFPSSISKLFNLQTLIIETELGNLRKLKIQFEILQMPKLRHLIIVPSFDLSYPSNIGVIHESDLQTLERVTNLIFTEEAIKLLVNTKKMGVLFTCPHWDDLCLDNLFHLQKLDELKVYVDYDIYSRIWNYAFPMSLTKLTLRGVCLPWDNMSIIGSLPNLQVLAIIDCLNIEDSEWMPIEGQFLRLKGLCSTFDHLVKWEVEKEHFPSLESLILNEAPLIDEIPCGIGEIDTLQLIGLRSCGPSVVNSAMRIKEQQHENGNYAFQVRVSNPSTSRLWDFVTDLRGYDDLIWSKIM